MGIGAGVAAGTGKGRGQLIVDEFTAGYLRSILDYDPFTGVFTWLYRDDMPNCWNARYHGRAAGNVSPDYPYVHIRIRGRLYKGGRLAHLWMTGKWPKNEIDYKDLDTLNNKWDNLRAATRSRCIANSKRSSNNKSGYKGVCWINRERKWRAQIAVDNKRFYLGDFDTPEAASTAYAEAANKYFGEFARAA